MGTPLSKWLIAALVGISVPSAMGATSYSTVALTGQAAPGTPAGVNFSTLDNTAQTNPDGTISFTASLAGSGVTTSNNTGIWAGLPGAFQLVAREGDQALALPAGVNYGPLSGTTVPLLSASGAGLAFRAPLTGLGVTSANDAAIWSGTAGALTLVTREGDAAPGLSGVNFSAIESLPQRTASGVTQLENTLSGSGVTLSNDESLWQHSTGGGLALRVREGDPAPGAPAGRTLSTLVGFLSQNSSANFAFTAYINGTVGIEGTGVWITLAVGAPQPVALTGQPAPGTPAGVNFALDFHPGAGGVGPKLNNANQTAFIGRISGAGVDSTNDSGIWLGSTSGTQLVAREGAPAPGVSDGVLFGSMTSLSRIEFNDAGMLVFTTPLTGPSVTTGNDTAAFRGTPGSLQLLMREGDPAPGTPAGTLFGQIDPLDVITRDGEAMINAALTGPDVTTANDRGFWWADRTGALTLIAREGDVIDVDDGPGQDLRTISSIFLVFNESTDNLFPQQRVPLRLTFTGGGSAIVMATVPEPIQSLVPGIGLIWAVLARPRRDVTEARTLSRIRNEPA